MTQARIEPTPTPEEAAAVVAALGVLRAEASRIQTPVRDRWRLAGLLGHPVPPGVKPGGSLWSYSSWGGI